MWARQTGLTHRSLNLLLGHLRHHFPLTKLPRDARTLMNTPVSGAPETALTPIAGGQLAFYQGVEKCLLSYFRDCQPTQEGFELNIFVDGLPLHKSSRTQFWPILMQAHNVPDTPVMTVAIFCGESKPLFVKEFLQPFVDEMNRLFVTCLTIKSPSYWVEARAIIADAPARAFIKGVKSHNAYSACMKCTIVGELEGHRMYFPYGEQCAHRNHKDFCDDKYPTHVNNPTPFTSLLGCDIIDDFVSAEDIHLKRLNYFFGNAQHYLYY
ncbi:uncharacterized protein LOC121591554 [Anopheles merus]|uniref:uncharacterized protein LOC121591553 n=1 Tax=Anopheles merus TaxID=30066 RepID=UPI001BE4AD40|nr:uncharacterized protein LOC121591553 [Anopheles merus]XP_041768133.1 uncharacterized protein LOC121591554 [Anopheles merus]